MSLLTNPLFAVGQGLLGSATGTNPWGGIGQGLLAAQYAKGQESQNQYRQMQMQELQRRQQQEIQQAQQAEVQRRIQSANVEAFIQKAGDSLPPGMDNALRANPELLKDVTGDMMKPAEAPKTAKDINGVERYLEGPQAGQPVFPDVQKAPESMTPYQQAQLDIDRQRLALSQSKQGEKDATTAAEEEQRAQAKIEQNQIAIGSIDDAKRIIDDNFFSAGMASNFVPDALAGTSERALKGKIETIQSAIGLQKLLDIKAQGGTFGALSEKELGLLTSSLSSLDPNLPKDELKRNLDTVKMLLQKANAEAGNTPQAGNVMQEADAILGGGR